MTSTLNPKPEKDLCRCCHAEGKFKNLAEPCYVGKDEVYSDVLRYCFDINLSPVPGILCTSTYKICNKCIIKLQDAVNFKKKVLSCEERFQDMFGRLNIVKEEDEDVNVKVELLENDNSDFVDEEDEGNEEDFNNDNDVSDDQKTEEETIESSPKKSKKAKEKPSKSKKRKKAGEAEAEEDGDDDGSKKKAKKGRRRPSYYTVVDNEYTCNLCQKQFSAQHLVSQHYRFVHLKRRPRERKCPKCDKKIPGYLRADHLEKVHGVPAPECKICEKKFRYPGLVVQHQKKVHMGEKTAVCHVCSKGFFDKLSLRLHMSTHSSEMKFKCGVCGREFRWSHNLKDHKKIHTGDKRYVCKICEISFVQKSTLKQHSRRNHPGVNVD